MQLNLITNPDPNLQEKMRFFADYFQFANQFLGELPDIPFDNPYSLLDKIIFQIERNPRKFHIYVDYYFQQFFSFYDAKESKADILTLGKFFRKYNLQSRKNKKEWVTNNPDFISEIKKCHAKYEKTLFENNFSSLFSFLQCPHSLKNHQKDIKLCVQILVSQFRLNGYSKEHVDSSIHRILSHEQFPFPPEIIQIEDVLEKGKAEEAFLEKRDFKEQFFGLKYLLTRPKVQSGAFLFVIENCAIDVKLKDDFKIQFDKVTFISPTHQLLFGLRKFSDENENGVYKQIKRVFFRENIFLAYLTLGYDTLEFGKVSALKIVYKELQQFNSYVGTELSVNTKHFLFTRDFSKIEGGSISMFNDIANLRTDEIKKLESNAYEVLRDVSSVAKRQILLNEDVFDRSLQNDDISFYWHYIENIFSSIEIIDIPVIIKKISMLLFNQKDKFRKELLRQINFLVFPIGLDFKEIGLDNDDVFIRSEGIMMKMRPISEIIALDKKITSPFLKYIIVYYKKFEAATKDKIWLKHFESIIIELYSYRNAELHTGIVNAYSQLKLRAILPSLINIVRWRIIYSCKANPHLSFKELMELVTLDKKINNSQ